MAPFKPIKVHNTIHKPQFSDHTKKQHTTLTTYRRPTMEAAVAATPQVQLKHHKNIPTTTNNYASLSSYASFLNIHHNTKNRHNKNRNTKRCICLSVSSKPTSNSTETQKPQIELEFLSPKPEPDGTYQRQTVTAESGEKLIRNIMNENKIELYGTYGKVMNCGGGGSCGTCIVEIVDGGELLNQRTNTENKYLKKKPESWRLACQTIVGNKENAGKVIVQRLPQWKK